MSKSKFNLPKAPIVEAVLDIDCDMPSSFDLAALEGSARAAFCNQYPKPRSKVLEQGFFEHKPDEVVKHPVSRAIQALQFLHEDEKQLVQMREQGFSFNRLEPYTSFDDYLPEIQRAWELFASITSPVLIRVVRLRYINRILLPFIDGRVKPEKYFKICPRLPIEKKLLFGGFLNQHTAVEVDSERQVNIVLASQLPENGKISIIFDICVTSKGTIENNWVSISNEIKSLRDLKNRIFINTLTKQCLKQFQ